MLELACLLAGLRRVSNGARMGTGQQEAVRWGSWGAKGFMMRLQVRLTGELAERPCCQVAGQRQCQSSVVVHLMSTVVDSRPPRAAAGWLQGSTHTWILSAAHPLHCACTRIQFWHNWSSLPSKAVRGRHRGGEAHLGRFHVTATSPMSAAVHAESAWMTRSAAWVSAFDVQDGNLSSPTKPWLREGSERQRVWGGGARGRERGKRKVSELQVLHFPLSTLRFPLISRIIFQLGNCVVYSMSSYVRYSVEVSQLPSHAQYGGG